MHFLSDIIIWVVWDIMILVFNLLFEFGIWLWYVTHVDLVLTPPLFYFPHTSLPSFFNCATYTKYLPYIWIRVYSSIYRSSEYDFGISFVILIYSLSLVYEFSLYVWHSCLVFQFAICYCYLRLQCFCLLFLFCIWGCVWF